MAELGVTVLHIPYASALQVLSTAKEMGFKSVELPAFNWPGETMVNPNVTGRVAHLASLVQNLGIRVSSLQCHVGLVDSGLSETVTRQRMEFIKSVFEAASRLKTDVVHVIANRLEKLPPEREGWKVLRRVLTALLRAAERQGVTLALEPCVKTLVHDKATTFKLFDEFKELKLNFDPSHFACASEKPTEVLGALGDRIVHMHAKDGVGPIEVFRFTPLGEGSVDWLSLVRHIKQMSYRGVISIEYEGYLFGFEKDPLKGIAQDKRFMEALLRENST